MALSDILNVSKMGVFGSQTALKVVSHNISNVNTPGYSRQSVSFTNNTLLNDGGKMNGGEGVSVSGVSHKFDELVDNRLLSGERELGRLTARDRLMHLVEEVYNELDGDGLSTRMESFYSAVDDLAISPLNPVAQEEVVSQADALARFANNMNDSLSELTLPVDQEITLMLDDVNTRLTNLRDVNADIIRQEATGQPALDLLDQRRTMMMELGNLVDIQTVQTDDGGVSIFTGNGQLLLDHDYTASYTRGPQEDDSDNLSIIFAGVNTDYTDNILGGQLKGLLEVRDEVLNGDDGFLTQLEGLIDEIRYQMNTVHGQSVNRDMRTELTGVFSLGSYTDTALEEIPLTSSDDGYDADFPPPPDLARAIENIQAFYDGTGTLLDAANQPEITFAYGPDATSLQPFSVEVVDPATGKIRSFQALADAINNASGNDGNLTASIDADGAFKLAVSGDAQVFGVAEDNTGLIAAMGVGAMFSGTGAEDMAVNTLLMEDSANLASVKINMDDPANPVFDDADNSGMLALGALRSERLELNGRNASLASHYANIVGTLGSELMRNQEALQSQQTAQSFITEVRESVSGVSLEEELTDLIRFQRSFQASSKMVSVADQLMDTIIRMV
ncbi:MAG: flagellar hook-associated protein FlgK [Magnetococcales bacterium]|nr:flagellar hook-associated protein FlgK [Magnetococcales bacterium]